MRIYKIIRYFFLRENETIFESLSLEEAQKHCNNPETSSKSCKSKESRAITEKHGPWFDGYVRE